MFRDNWVCVHVRNVSGGKAEVIENKGSEYRIREVELTHE